MHCRLFACSGAAREAVIEAVRSTARFICNADGARLRDMSDIAGDPFATMSRRMRIGPLWKGQRFPMSACISGWSMPELRGTAVIEDIFADPIPMTPIARTFVTQPDHDPRLGADSPRRRHRRLSAPANPQLPPEVASREERWGIMVGEAP